MTNDNRVQLVQLEVGKRYRNRLGEVVKIVGFDYTAADPYKDDDGNGYSRGGHFFLWGETSNDLVEEVTNDD